MKKLQFIIPKVLNRSIISGITKGLLLFVTLFFASQKSLAAEHDYGCRMGNRIFQVYDTEHPSPTNFQYDSDNNLSPNGYVLVGGRCDNGGTTECTLYAYDEMTIMGHGVLADFSIDYCPLDDYVITLFIFTLCMGFWKLIRPKSIPYR